MISISEMHVLICGASGNNSYLEFYFVSNVTDLKIFQVGISTTQSPRDFVELKRLNLGVKITARNDFSFQNHLDIGYLFGGNVNGTDQNDFYKITIIDDSRQFSMKYEVLKIESYSKENVPKARSAHASSILYDELFIFGGKHEGKYLNDLHVYSIEKNVWQEILTTISPPPLCFSTFNMLTNNVAILYGGLDDKIPSNEIYSFDNSNKKWKILDIMSRKDDILGDLQIPIFGHETSLISQKLFVFGGSDGVNVLDNAISIENIHESMKNELLQDFLMKNKKLNYMCDLKLITKDKSSNSREIFAHKFVLASRCQFFNQMFQKNKDKEIELFDFKYELLEIYINFLYSGNLIIEEKDLIEEFLTFINSINQENYLLFQKICSFGSIDLSITNEIAEDFFDNFSNLLEDDVYSDLKIILDDGTKINAHKLILYRCPYFKNMFNSGMIESVSDEIVLEGIEKSVFQEIFKYLYLDKIEITNKNCVRIFLKFN